MTKLETRWGRSLHVQQRLLSGGAEEDTLPSISRVWSAGPTGIVACQLHAGMDDKELWITGVRRGWMERRLISLPREVSR